MHMYIYICMTHTHTYIFITKGTLLCGGKGIVLSINDAISVDYSFEGGKSLTFNLYSPKSQKSIKPGI